MTKQLEQQSGRKQPWRTVLRLCCALAALFACYRLSANSVRAGLSRTFSTVSIVQSAVEPADIAVRFGPDDPEAHYTRALSLVNLQRLDEAVVELKEATRLRPHHYYEWLDLGVTLDRQGDQEGAIKALNESIRLAPAFAQPHWQLGSLLFRRGQYAEAFAEMHQAVKSDPNLTEDMLNLAWAGANSDVVMFEAFARPESKRAYLDVARFLATQGKGREAAAAVQKGGPAESEEDLSILHETISRLIASREFLSAFEIWKISHPQVRPTTGKPAVLNADFLDPISRDDPGYGWQLQNVKGISVAIDPSGPSPGVRSLRFEFAGEIPSENSILSQLVLIEPKNRYSLTFMAKSDGLVTGGPPLCVVLDPTTSPAKALGQSKPVSGGPEEWSTYRVDFSTENTQVALISFRRVACSQSPCPIFGKLWLSSFSLSKLS